MEQPLSALLPRPSLQKVAFTLLLDGGDRTPGIGTQYRAIVFHYRPVASEMLGTYWQPGQTTYEYQ